MHYTTSSSVLKILYKLLELHHQDSDTLFHSFGLAKADITDERKRIPYETVHKLWLEASEMIDNPCYGIKAAEIFHPSDLNILGYAWLSSSTLRSAFERLYRFQKMINEFVKISLSELDETFEIILGTQEQGNVTMAQFDMGASIILKMCQSVYRQPLKPLAVYLAHPKPNCFKQYENYFDCKIYFSQPETKVSFPVGILDEPLLNATPDVSFMLDKTIIEYLESMHGENIASKVKQAITTQLPSAVSIEKITNQLNMTPRTLHRYLKAEGTSYKQILNDVRYELSKQYISQKQYNVTEIAFQLGFSDSSAFSRAFKHWSGFSPSHYNKHH